MCTLGIRKNIILSIFGYTRLVGKSYQDVFKVQIIKKVYNYDYRFSLHCNQSFYTLVSINFDGVLNIEIKLCTLCFPILSVGPSYFIVGPERFAVTQLG